jgi:hypothetical protein
MSYQEERYIGLRGSGNETEYDIVRETERALLLRDDYGTEFWMPKSAFESDGTLKTRFYNMLEEKLEGSV